VEELSVGLATDRNHVAAQIAQEATSHSAAGSRVAVKQNAKLARPNSIHVDCAMDKSQVVAPGILYRHDSPSRSNDFQAGD
jgi:hypothetical protein